MAEYVDQAEVGSFRLTRTGLHVHLDVAVDARKHWELLGVLQKGEAWDCGEKTLRGNRRLPYNDLLRKAYSKWRRPLRVVIRLSAQEELKALPILLRHSPGMVLANRTYILSDSAVRALRRAGVKFTERCSDMLSRARKGAVDGERGRQQNQANNLLV